MVKPTKPYEGMHSLFHSFVWLIFNSYIFKAQDYEYLLADMHTVTLRVKSNDTKKGLAVDIRVVLDK